MEPVGRDGSRPAAPSTWSWWFSDELTTSSMIAYITMQLPARVAIDASMLMPSGGS